MKILEKDKKLKLLNLTQYIKNYKLRIRYQKH